MKNNPLAFFFFDTTALFALTACFWTGWHIDYEKPATQFYAADLGALGKPFIGKKITVREPLQDMKLASRGICGHLEWDDSFHAKALHKVC